ETVLANKELKVAVENEQLVIKYYDAAYPLNLNAYRTILKRNEPGSNNSIKELIEQISSLSGIEEPNAYSRRYDEIKLQFASLITGEKNNLNLQEILKAVNDDPDLLGSIVDDQEYRLCFWQETDQKINFRRFFTVNGLICLNIQDKSVFEQYHEFIKSLVEEKAFDGLRIDHIDGLYDPTQYLTELRELVGPETYIVVEKILESGEKLPEQWPIQGETGYGFLSIVNNLFTNTSNKDKFLEFYQELISDKSDVHRQISEKKALILKEHMGGELENLLQLFLDLNLLEQHELQSVDKEQLKEAIGAFLIECPVYRYYGNQLPLSEDESKSLKKIFQSIRNKNASLTEATGILEDIITEKPLQGNEEFNNQALKFYQRLMQFSGPLMAKGVEDTLMYTYNNFIGHNEVGDAPDAFGISIPAFHEIMLDRQQNWPLAINTTSTHDTKRGEDVRMRLNVLSDLPEEWFSNVREWREMNVTLKKNNKPDVNDEYFIYQTIAGAYPMPGEEEDNFSERIQEYLPKALREAKVNSNWTSPNEEYEAAAKQFAVNLLDKNGAFWKKFTSFHQKISDFGIVNSLSQVILKFTCPGVPDVYQGTELWDLSLVDPDNRRAVDYEKRLRFLEEVDDHDDQNTAALWKNLWNERYNAKIKLSLIRVLFNARKDNPELFDKGKYLPLTVEGQFKDHIVAFAREYQQKLCVVVIPLSVATLCENQKCDIVSLDWRDTKVLLPENAVKDWQNVIIDIKGKAEGFLNVQELFQDIPVAVLQFEPKKERAGGVLLHITSLPSPFGIGDLGSEARKFADFLHRTRQQYWQLLPLNPTEKAQFHSPYSSISSMAGNPLLISPELLVKEGLLAAEDLEQYYLPQENRADFEAASKAKAEMFTMAWENFKRNKFENLRSEFQTFC
ncbi:MAG TPA: malto-oligosyltrehalose synthase, partial [Salinimicrobium sp.]|nr:malto-oligosyltrehalose synthase [Salinimicrobium sp.]